MNTFNQSINQRRFELNAHEQIYAWLRATVQVLCIQELPSEFVLLCHSDNNTSKARALGFLGVWELTSQESNSNNVKLLSKSHHLHQPFLYCGRDKCFHLSAQSNLTADIIHKNKFPFYYFFSNYLSINPKRGLIWIICWSLKSSESVYVLESRFF